MIDIALDKKNHDLIIEDFDFVLYDDVSQIMQNLNIRLRFFLGEWFLNVFQGIPYYEAFFIKNPNLIFVESYLKNEILTTRGILELTEFETSFESKKRIYKVRFSALAISGEQLSNEMELQV